MKPRDIGTRAETEACRLLRGLGWTGCDRQPLRGNRDQGDLLINGSNPRIIAEVKAGVQADTASHNLIREWMDQTDLEAVHAGADLGVLIVRRKGRNVEQWDAWMPASDWIDVLTGDSVLLTDAPWPLRASLRHWSDITKAWADDR